MEAQNPKRTLGLIEKGDYEKAYDVIEKSIEKDTINPVAFYTKSILFLVDSFPYYDIDSGYVFALTALHHLTRLETKEIEKLQKQDITDSILLIQKTKIDELSFYRTQQTNTEEAFNNYLEKHPTSTRLEEAIMRRNELAFANAQAVDTYQAYDAFIQKYPYALQVNQAKKYYEILVFEAKTKERTLPNYQQFLQQFPETPFRLLLEKNILEMKTVNNEINAYKEFIKQYPKSIYAIRAGNMLYYLEEHNVNRQKNFTPIFPDNKINDSLNQIFNLPDVRLFPVFDKKNYLFINEKGDTVLTVPDGFKIDPAYYCEGQKEDFFVIQSEAHKFINNRANNPLFKGEFDIASALPFGLIKIEKNSQVGILHRSGWQILDIAYDEISILNGKYLKVELNGKYGLFTMTGREICHPVYDQIEHEGIFYMLQKDQKFSIINDQTLKSAVQEDHEIVGFKFDDYEYVNDDYIIGVVDNFECLIDKSLEEVIPVGNYAIYEREGGWLLLNTSKYQYFNDQFQFIYERNYVKFSSKAHWDALKSGDYWYLLRPANNYTNELSFDSLYLLSDHVVYTEKHGYHALLLQNEDHIEISDQQTFKFLPSKSPQMVGIGENAEYYCVIDEIKRNVTLYAATGEQLFNIRNITVDYAYDSLLVIERRNRKGIMNMKGKLILDPKFDGIVAASNGQLNLIANNRFGLFIPKINKTISPQFERPLSPYNDQYFEAMKDGKIGLIDLNGNTMVPFEFDKIQYWSDSLALVQQEGLWSIYDFFNDRYQVDEIIKFEIIHSRKGTWSVIYKSTGFGVIQNSSGLLIEPSFNDVYIIGDPEEWIFLCEKYVAEADIYVILYFDKWGNKLLYHVYTPTEYENILCSQ